jgi:outer membrane protein assembly factor BamE (lipoprotein component of BamABCDE complex)
MKRSYWEFIFVCLVTVFLASCASSSKEKITPNPPEKSGQYSGKSSQSPASVPVPDIYQGGKKVAPEQANRIVPGETTRQEVIALIGEPSLETPAVNGGVLLCYHYLSEKKFINPANVILFGPMNTWILTPTERKRDVVWIMIGPDNKVSKTAKYIESEMHSSFDVPADADLFDGKNSLGFPIHYVSDPPGAKIEFSQGSLSGFSPYRRGPAVIGNAPYAPFKVIYTKVPANASILKNWCYRAVWEDGRKSRKVYLVELFASPRDFIFRPNK